MNLLDTYHHYITEVADRRTNIHPLISSPVPILLISAAYLYYVLDYGPRYMKNKQPYSLKTFIFWYNVFQICINLYMIYLTYEAGWFGDGFLFCTELDYSYNDKPMKIIAMLLLGLNVKISDYIETIVFVLRKKDRQVSFLHLYHHVSTVLLSWYTVKYFPNGYAVMVGFVNSIIHIIMYSYYLLTSYGPEMQKKLAPFKPILTTCQMVQFVVLITYLMQAFIPGCPEMQYFAGIMIINLLINFVLFYNFYRQNYTLSKNKKK
ncbi:very long chain fatty acid elongase AAEL008004-like [Nomia melanderi]|uniref:very long chain fatty acid elongase AAEL008004-like n=1 Tax=Nomia melanderi TaxID=2448451 RepID=UPI003FCE0010